MFCKHVLEFGSKLLRYLSFSGVHVRTGAGHYISELFTMPWGMLRLLLLVVNRSCPCDLIHRSPRRCLRLARGPGYINYPDRYACRAQTNILAMESPSREVFRPRSTRKFDAPRGVHSRAVTISHPAVITSSLTKIVRDDHGRAPGFHRDFSAQS
jgi:hypothetical protein